MATTVDSLLKFCWYYLSFMVAKCMMNCRVRNSRRIQNLNLAKISPKPLTRIKRDSCKILKTLQYSILRESSDSCQNGFAHSVINFYPWTVAKVTHSWLGQDPVSFRFVVFSYTFSRTFSNTTIRFILFHYM